MNRHCKNYYLNLYSQKVIIEDEILNSVELKKQNNVICSQQHLEYHFVKRLSDHNQKGLALLYNFLKKNKKMPARIKMEKILSVIQNNKIDNMELNLDNETKDLLLSELKEEYYHNLEQVSSNKFLIILEDKDFFFDIRYSPFRAKENLLTQSPKISQLSQSPKRNQLSQSPKRSLSNNFTQSPKRSQVSPKRSLSNNFTQSPKRSRVWPKRILSNNLTQSPKRSQVSPKRILSNNFTQSPKRSQVSPRRSISNNFTQSPQKPLITATSILSNQIQAQSSLKPLITENSVVLTDKSAISLKQSFILETNNSLILPQNDNVVNKKLMSTPTKSIDMSKNYSPQKTKDTRDISPYKGTENTFLEKKPAQKDFTVNIDAVITEISNPFVKTLNTETDIAKKRIASNRGKNEVKTGGNKHGRVNYTNMENQAYKPTINRIPSSNANTSGKAKSSKVVYTNQGFGVSPGSEKGKSKKKNKNNEVINQQSNHLIKNF